MTTPDSDATRRVDPRGPATPGALPTTPAPEPGTLPHPGDASREDDEALRTVRRPTGVGRLIRIGFLAVVVVFAVIWVWKNRHQVGAAWGRVSFWPVAGALVASALAAWSGVPAWRDLLLGLGSRLRLRDAQRVFLMGQLGKYIPGGVWTVLAQATMAKELHVPRARSGTASLMAILLAVVSAVLLGAACLGIAGHQVLGRYGWWLLLVLPMLALLHPGVLVWVGVVAGRLTGRSIPLERIPERTLLGAAGWLSLGQLCNGVSFYLLVGSISGDYSNPLLSIGLFSLAAAVGILVIFAPAGAGARDVILAFGLAGVTDPGSAVLIVLMSRVVLTIVDVVLAASAAGIGRRRRAATGPQS